jgi:hypothetical protein
MKRPDFFNWDNDREQRPLVGKNDHRKPSDVERIGAPGAQLIARQRGILHHRKRETFGKLLCAVKGHHLNKSVFGRHDSFTFAGVTAITVKCLRSPPEADLGVSLKHSVICLWAIFKNVRSKI